MEVLSSLKIAALKNKADFLDKRSFLTYEIGFDFLPLLPISWLFCVHSDIDSSRAYGARKKIGKMESEKPSSYSIPPADSSKKDRLKYMNFQSLRSKWVDYRTAKEQYIESRNTYIKSKKQRNTITVELIHF